MCVTKVQKISLCAAFDCFQTHIFLTEVNLLGKSFASLLCGPDAFDWIYKKNAKFRFWYNIRIGISDRI